ncbi:MAG: glycosyltransferase family 4 protein [Cyanobacterium sp. T60_A2020_053]|nr:glycosyltransferase family 4 protein [Cyanobacterium sp. T60_A2020_053]
MIKILHIIDYHCLGGAARSMIAIAKYSSRLDNQFHHQVISLKAPFPDALKLSEEAGMEYLPWQDETERNELIAQADIVHIQYWNNPRMFAFMQSELPPARIITWFHVAGDHPPQIITRDLINHADFAIPCNPHSYELPVVKALKPEIRQKKVGMVYDATDFERVENVQPKAHQGFNVGYMGSLSFSKMHPNYIAMSARANIPDVKFILCGGGNIELLKNQARELNAEDKFQFQGFVEDIASEIAYFDVYGYPLCEDTYAAAELNLQEAMYAGIPPVVFPHGGVKKLIINNYTGLMVDSPLEYSQALEYLYHNPEERIRLGKNAKEYASQIFGAENAARQLNPIYHRLMASPKRARAWSIPVDGNLLDEPVSLLDVVDIPPEFKGAKTFIESIGDTAPYFLTNLTSKNDQELFDTDNKIANSSILLGSGEGGVIQYLNYFPNDGFLRFWTALILEKQGNVGGALRQLMLASDKGCKHWRISWYIAQMAEYLGEIQVLQQALNNLDYLVPNFQPAEKLKIRLNELLEAEKEQIKLTETNYLIFPHWQSDEEELTEELYNLIHKLAILPSPSGRGAKGDGIITLIIDTTGITEEDANLILSGIAMNLMLEEELDLENSLDFALISNLNQQQWSQLLTQITAKVNLKNENQTIINELEIDDLITLDGAGNNYAIFPDWSADQEQLAEEIGQVLTNLAGEKNCTLLVNVDNIDQEEVGLFFSEIAMNLMLIDGIELFDTVNVSFVNFILDQWSNLGGLIKEKITIDSENLPDNLFTITILNDSQENNM